MELALFIYLAGVVGNVSLLITSLGVTSAAVCVLYTVAYFSEYSHFKFDKAVVIVPLVIASVATVIPSEKTVYMMLAGYTGQQVIQSETASKLHKVIYSKLDEYLSEVNTKRSSSGVIMEKK